MSVDVGVEKRGRIRVEVSGDINIGAPIAQRLVDIELMKKVGQMVMAGEPMLLVDGERIYWKVPFVAVPPDDDPNTYPIGVHALVDAIAGTYTLTQSDKEAIRHSARPILYRLHPGLEDEVKQVHGANA
ncbi:MAG: hypothetical protein O3A46_15840 [Candidatus Poribacteria bacterium]|nr:hypothetical protein [Candidatus Poribacteria bacterium]